MSRRITFCVLAATAALVAAPASADPECFGDTCHLPQAAEPLAAAVPSPDPDEAAAPEANAAVQKLAPARALPQVVAEPVVRPPVPSIGSVADDASTPREPTKLARREPPLRPAPGYAKAPPAPARVVEAVRSAAVVDEVPERVVNAPPVQRARTVRISSTEPGYVQGYNQVPNAGIVVVVPNAIYTARYLVAPSAKIIAIDSDD